MHHLDNAATTWPKPESVIEAVARAIRDVSANPSRGATSAARAAGALLEDARTAVADFFRADPARLAFTAGATDALAVALRSLVRPGVRVVTSPFEHAAVMRTLRRLERDHGVRLAIAPADEAGVVDPDALARMEADVVVLTAASNVTGRAQPVAAVARALAARRTPLVVDGAQAAGSLPLDVSALGPRSVVAITGHKALLGVMGAGALAVGSEVDLHPLREGGTGDSLDPFQPSAMPRRLEAGTPPLPAIAGLAAGIAWWTLQGPDAVRAREGGELARLVAGLRAVPGVAVLDDAPGDRAPVVSFVVAGWSPEEVGMVLDSEHGITVRAGLHCAPDAHRALGTFPDGTVRASLGPTTPPESVDALLSAVAEIASA